MHHRDLRRGDDASIYNACKFISRIHRATPGLEGLGFIEVLQLHGLQVIF